MTLDQTLEVEIAEPVNERDAINNDVAAAIAQLKGANTEEPPEAPIEEPEQPVEQRPVAEKERDPKTGQFVPKAEPTEAPVKAASEPKQASTDTQTKVSPADTSQQPAPPVGWTPDAKAEWSNLSPAIKAAVAKREAEISSGGRQWSEEKRRYEQVLAPVAQEATRLGMGVDQAINALMAAHHRLNQDAPGAIMQLAQQFGVDLAALVSNPPAPQPQVRSDPLVPQLTQKLSTLESQLNGFLQNQTMGVVESFASSSDHPHYAEVENELLRLIPMVQQSEPGLMPQQVLQKAYDQAIWLNPEVRAKIIAEQQAATQQQHAATVTTKATQAKKAAVSIKGSSNGVAATQKATPPGKDVYEDVRNAINSLRN